LLLVMILREVVLFEGGVYMSKIDWVMLLIVIITMIITSLIGKGDWLVMLEAFIIIGILDQRVSNESKRN